MIHLYCGDGKGKTTAAMGPGPADGGSGPRGVVIAQFLKGADSGERAGPGPFSLKSPLLEVPQQIKFIFQMSPEEREAECRRALALLEQAEALARERDCGLLVLDEACGAVETGLLPPVRPAGGAGPAS